MSSALYQPSLFDQAFDFQRQKIIDDPVLVDQELARLNPNLSIKAIHERVLLLGGIERANVSMADVPGAGSMRQWMVTAKSMRLGLADFGYKLLNKTNVAYAVSPCRTHVFRIMTGDKATGVSHLTPRNSSPKGKTLDQAINNIHQLQLFENGEIGSNPFLAILLFNTRNNTVYSEISIPSGFFDKYITEFAKRLILPPMSLSSGVDVETTPNSPEPEFNFDVERLAT
ncbi:hypothetical protein LH462_11050 [Laribacter hongkongensis]|uniref:Uncharacterized protein n=1 Tax=Laribacter hongkongensis TaxID=168471 RepID=A0ABD4SSP4_9NEIS|nr:hypothetical protein [Laribacter hongkongensis]MCG9026735.1 hypothetical protein [Laribacter hongkongensis]MCG9101619.1 hypothetical protein [Laribacter hongkongensis]MCG9104255.1 hypothetical protein [Laribacter hongkongensis]MCG9113488.1 hypothetical protein [Laribacter hongkongensis]MCG9119226.1 hypothetical protein [Laribacter hongkongensis]